MIYDPHASADLQAKVVNSLVLPEALSNAPIYGLLCISDYNGHPYSRVFKTQIENGYDKRVKMILNSAARVAPRWRERMSSTTDVYYRVTGIINPRTHAIRLGLNALMKIITAKKCDVGYWLYNHIHSEELWGTTSILKKAMGYMVRILSNHQHIYNTRQDGEVCKQGFNLTGAIPPDIKKILLRQGVESTTGSLHLAQKRAEANDIKMKKKNIGLPSVHFAREREILMRALRESRSANNSKPAVTAPSTETLRQGLSLVRPAHVECFDADTLLMRGQWPGGTTASNANISLAQAGPSTGRENRVAPAKQRGLVMRLQGNGDDNKDYGRRENSRIPPAQKSAQSVGSGKKTAQSDRMEVEFVGSSEFQDLGRQSREEVKEEITRAAKDAQEKATCRKTQRATGTEAVAVANVTKLGHNPNRPTKTIVQ